MAEWNQRVAELMGVPGEEKRAEGHHSPGEQIFHGAERAHELADAGVSLADGGHKLFGFGGKDVAERLHLGKSFLAGVGLPMNVGKAIGGFRKGGVDGVMDGIEGSVGAVENGAELLGAGPIAGVAKAFGFGFKAGRWLDDKLGISDAISEETSGRKALMEQQGLHWVKNRGDWKEIGTNYPEMIRNHIHKQNMLLKGLHWDPAVGNWVPQAGAGAAPPAGAAEPFQHYAD